MTLPSSERQHWERFWAGGRSVEDIYPTGGRIQEALSEFFDPRGKWVLEVGAGTGRDSLELARAGAQVVTLDYSENAVRIVRGIADSEQVNLHPVRADAFAMPFSDATFDLVFHQGLMEHFRDPLALLRENARVLKPGGLLLVDVPQKYHLYTLVKHMLMWLGRWFAGWETEYTIGQLVELVREAGLRPVHVYGDWMRPSFFYRALRTLLLSFGVRLPMYPRGVPVVRKLRAWVREKARRRKWAYYTFLDIGVVAEKPGELVSLPSRWQAEVSVYE